MATPLVAVTNLSKQFPGVRALDNVDLDVLPSEVHALVGENGAGKSTLIKILAGLLHPTTGTILVQGRPVNFATPLQARAAGISVITQEFNLVPQLTVAENIFLGQEPVSRSGLVDREAMHRRSRELLKELGLAISPTQRVEYLAVADQQLVEIAKALSHEFQVIIMDEPTAALNAAEVDRLLAITEAIRARGRAVLYVSHRLNEIFRISDRVTVLRDGKWVATLPTSACTEREVVTLMLGRAVEDSVIPPGGPPIDLIPAIEVRHLTIPGALSDVSFDLRYGEVLGIAGLVGSGRSELSRALVGILRPSAGNILVDGRPTRFQGPASASTAGIYMLSEDRRAEGIFPDLTVLENMVIGTEGQDEGRVPAVLHHALERSRYDSVRAELRVRAHSPSQLIPTLSGGNQQKVLLGRALVSKSRILVLNEPTRGVDVGTKMEIHELVRGLAKQGFAILVSSSDMPEVANVSDRCLVLTAGRVTGHLAGPEVTEGNILACAMGQASRESV